MTEKEFRLCVEWGLGRALLFLQSDPHPERMRDVLWQFYTGSFIRAFSEYDAELIACLPDAELFRRQLYEALPADPFVQRYRAHISFLQLLGYEVPLRERAEVLYTDSLQKLRTAMEIGAAAQEVTERARAYSHALHVLVFWFSWEDDVFRRTLRDTVSVLENGDSISMETEGELLHLFFGVSLRKKADLVEEMAEEGRIWHKIREILRTPVTSRFDAEPIPGLTMAQVLDMTEAELDTPIPGKHATLFCRVEASFPRMSEEDIRTAAQIALSDPDPRRRARMLHLFQPSAYAQNPPAFPLPPAGLIALAEAARKRADSSETPELWPALSLLCLIRHEDVRAYAKKLLAEYPYGRMSREKGAMRATALRMMLMENYRPEDREFLAGSVRKKRIWEHSVCGSIFIEKLLRGDGELPLECAPYLMRTSPYERYNLIYALLQNGSLSPEMREECRLDAHPAIRKLVEQ